MMIKNLYDDGTTTVQRILIKVGDCKMIKYRQIIKNEELGTISVSDLKEPPQWMLREKKLKDLLND